MTIMSMMFEPVISVFFSFRDPVSGYQRIKTHYLGHAKPPAKKRKEKKNREGGEGGRGKKKRKEIVTPE